jgi:thiol-disulfide isomerase/thioredoxin
MKKIIRLSFILALLVIVSAAKAQAKIPRWKIGDLELAIKNADRPTVINFWATFCKPCIAEIPHFQELVKKYDSAGVRLLLVSLDLPEAYDKIAAFAKKRGFTAPIVFLDESNADIFCPKVDVAWSGAIPATLFIDQKKGYRKFMEYGISKEKFEEELKAMLASKK